MSDETSAEDAAKTRINVRTCEACGHRTDGYPTRVEVYEEADALYYYYFHGDC